MKDKVAPTIPSHPVGFVQTAPKESFNWYGLTKREFFAAMAISAMAGNRPCTDEYSREAVLWADMLIKALND